MTQSPAKMYMHTHDYSCGLFVMVKCDIIVIKQPSWPADHPTHEQRSAKNRGLIRAPDGAHAYASSHLLSGLHASLMPTLCRIE